MRQNRPSAFRPCERLDHHEDYEGSEDQIKEITSKPKNISSFVVLVRFVVPFLFLVWLQPRRARSRW